MQLYYQIDAVNSIGTGTSPKVSLQTPRRKALNKKIDKKDKLKGGGKLVGKIENFVGKTLDIHDQT